MTFHTSRMFGAACAALASMALAGCASVAAGQQQITASAQALPMRPSASEQWLYGSAEGAIVSREIWADIAAYGEAVAQARPARSVVLGDGASADAPAYRDCGDRPMAAVFDADETMVWNYGGERYLTENGISGSEFGRVWDEWEKTGAGKALAIPGVQEAFARLRAAGITIIVNTNRSNANAAGTAATLAAAGLGDFTHGSTLYLKGDAPDGSGKDGRRAMIARDYCVVILAGDQLGDIADIFNAPGLAPMQRKAMVLSPTFSENWGHGWFVLPNPIYGPSIRGEYDDVYPAETRWSPETKDNGQ